MDIERLKGVVGKTIDLDVNGTFGEFVEQTGSEDVDAFLAFLLNRGLIDEALFLHLHGQADIELGAVVAQLHASLDGDRAPPAARYELLGPVGEGAMGVVHVARDRDLRRKVAFKSMTVHSVSYLRRFLDEVQITAQLDHPNVVPVYSLEVDREGRPAYAMKLVRGRTLDDLLRDARDRLDDGQALDEPLRLVTRLDHIIKICEAMAYAHSKGVVHRDLKPENVMIGRFGEVYVMDWGIAKLVSAPEADTLTPVDDDDAPMASADASGRTRMGAVLGTPAYMSPEQARGEVDAIGPASDQYALGLLLYEVVHLRRAYTGHEALVVLDKAERGALDPPPLAREPVSPELHAIIARATADDPASRYPSVEGLEADLRRHLRGEPTLALPDTQLRAAYRWVGHHQQAVLMSFALVVVLALSLVGAAAYTRQSGLAAERLVSESRARRTGELVAAVGARAQRIDNHFLWYEGVLEGIGAAATYAFARGTPAPPVAVHARDFLDPYRAPRGMVFSPKYGKEVSPEHPVYTVAPGIPPEVWQPDLALLEGLQPQLRASMIVSPFDPVPPDAPQAQRDRVTSSPDPMRWAYVALENSGLMYMFPGAKGWDEAYDPRTRPWYREALGQRGRRWGRPYVDLMGQGRLVSCVMPLYTATGALLGVAGVDLQFNALIDEHLIMEELPGFQASYLLAPDGQVMLHTSAAGDPIVLPPTEALDEGVDFGRFDRLEVVEAAAKSQAGYLIDGQRVLVWAPVQHLGWTYVVAADAGVALGVR